MRRPWYILLLPLLLGACTSIAPVIEVDTRQLPGRQNMLYEVSGMLADLGYGHILLPSPNRDKKEPVIDLYGEHRMRYRHPGAPEVRLDVRIRIADGATVIRFEEPGRKRLSEAGAALFRKLEARVERQFGQDNVRVFHRDLAAPF